MLVKKTINVTLAISEQPGRRIEFRDVLGKDFRHFEGSWEIERREGGLVVTYALDAKPMSQPPGFVGRMLMSGSARDQLEQVRAEILRRERHEEDNADNDCVRLVSPRTSRDVQNLGRHKRPPGHFDRPFLRCTVRIIPHRMTCNNANRIIES